MSNSNPRNDRGNVLLLTIGAMSLIAIAMILSVRAFSLRMEVSQRETRATEQRLVGSVAEDALDKWMANPASSKAILSDGAGRVWMTPLGGPCPSIADAQTICWRIRGDDPASPEDEDGVVDVPFADPVLRGGEARREARDVTIEVAVGCYTAPDPPNPTGSLEEHCQQISTSGSRRYERSVMFQYQLHYETNQVPPAALHGPGGLQDDPICEGDPADIPQDTVCDDPDLDPATVIVFTSEDELNGPLRYSGTGPVLYCGTPTFRRIETKIATLPARVPGCNFTPGINPDWEAIGTDPAPNWSDGLADPDRFISKGDLALLPPEEPPTDERCPLVQVDYDWTTNAVAKSNRITNMQDNDSTNDCPGEPSQSLIPHAILDGDTIFSTGTLTINRLVVDGSVTVYAKGDIIICGDIDASSGTNPAGGPNVVALITEGAVILDPSGTTPPSCNSGTLTALTTAQNLTLTNVAVLAAPNGAIYARGWHLPCTGPCPTLSIVGSIAAKHLGLYGIPDPNAGTVTAGWAKHFTYPTDFWQARPPWWPGYDDGIEEWAAA